jgi:hypothetical protein
MEILKVVSRYMRMWWVLVWCVMLFAAYTETLLGGIKATPTMVLIQSPSRTGSITVQNSTVDQDQEIWIDFEYGYQVPGEDGKFQIINPTSDSGGVRSASEWLRAYPQRFTIPPGGLQVVRIVTAPPPNLLDGEYVARIQINSKLSKPRTGSKNLTGRISVGFEIIEKSDLPFHYRRGILSTGLIVRDVKTTNIKDTLQVAVDLTRSGNTSYWGTAACRLKDKDGKVVGIIKKGVVVYSDGIYLFKLNIAKVTNGAYTLDLDMKSELTSAKKEYVVRAEPVHYSTSVNLP